MKLRQCELVINVDQLQVDLQEIFMLYKTIKQWAYIIHDKDDTRPHYHIYLHFDYAVDTELISKWFKVPANLVEKVKGRKADVLKYLTHSNKSQQHKHQYYKDEIIANFDFESEIANSDILGNFEKYSYAEMLNYCHSLSIDERTVAFSKLKKLWELECQCKTMEVNRNIQVVFITGKPGTGKTFYAKKILDKLHYDYCISSSSNDPFQDYLGQKAIILDDMRDDTFKKMEDLLKIIDNNTSSSVRSRFNNKVFNGKMIIITSSVPIQYWYSYLRYNNEYDELYQLYRRIGTFIQLTKEKVYIFENGLDEVGKPIGQAVVIDNEVPNLKTQKNTEKILISSVFED